jgi:hypothetical protein
VKKALKGLNPPKEESSVFPDLIVHDRTGSSALHNLLVAEAKKASTIRADDVDFDLRKLKLYKEQLKYNYAVYIELGQKPRWQWFGPHERVVSTFGDLSLQPVTDPVG